MTSATARRCVFLDRDGVLNKAIVRNGKPYPPRSLDEVEITEGARLSLDRLRDSGFLLVVVSNQPDVGRGQTPRDDVEAINRIIAEALPLDAIEVCTHDDAENCDCRKPKPGMLLRAGARFGIDLKQSFMVGDRWRDVEAGRRAGCRTVLIGDGYGENFPSEPTVKVGSLTAAVDWISRQIEA